MSAAATQSNMTSTMSEPTSQTVVASYRTHGDAEAAVKILGANGIPIGAISIIGRNFETKEQVLGFYTPGDAAIDGAATGAWFGGLFGLMLGAVGFFALPVVGTFFVLGPLAGMVAGIIGGAGVGALINALVAVGVPRDQALKYQQRLQAGEFLIVVQAPPADIARAHEILEGTAHTSVETHTNMPGDPSIVT
jgi:hypothetical protein